MAVASAGVVAALLAVDFLPTTDGPQHVLEGWLDGHYGLPGAPYADYLEQTTPVTGRGFVAVFVPLERLLGWRLAHQLTLAAAALGLAWGFAALVLAIRPARRWLALLGFVPALGWPLYMGFVSYQLGTGLGFYTLAVAAGRPKWRPVDRVTLSLLLLLQAVIHLFTAQATGLALVLLVLARPGRRLAELGRLALVGAPALVVLLLVLADLAAFDEPGTPQTTWLPAWAALAPTLRTFAAGPPWRAWPMALLAAGGLVGAGARWRELTPSERGLALISAVSLALSATLPFHLHAWQYLSPRFLPLALLPAIALLPVERAPAARAPLALALAAYAAAALVWATGHHRRLRATCDEALSGLEAPLRRSGPRLPLILDPLAGGRYGMFEGEVPLVEPLRHLGALYVVAQGGMQPYVFASSRRLHGYLAREGKTPFPAVPPSSLWYRFAVGDASRAPEVRRALLRALAQAGRGYEDVILYGRPEDADALLAEGYDQDYRNGGLLIARPRR